MLSSSRSAFAWLVVTVALSIGASAQFGVPLNHTDPKLEEVSVREMVARYCRLDYAGARLNPADWPKLQPLVAWRENPEYPLFMVASRFDVDANPSFEHGKYNVEVRYRLLGKFDLTEGYSEDVTNQVRIVRFTVAEVNGDWRITEIEPSYPNASRSAALQWVNPKLAGAQDAATKVIYQQALDLLQGQKVSPPAK